MRKTMIVLRARFVMSMKIYFRYPVNLVMTLFEPLMWLAPFYFMAKSFSQNGRLPGFESYAGNSDFVGFLVVGFMVSGYVSTVFWSMGFSLKDEMIQGVLESNWSAPVNRTLMLVSKSLFQLCAATFEAVLVGVVCHFAFGFTMGGNVLKALIFLIPGLVGMLGLGLAIAALVLAAKDAQPIIDLSNSLVMGFSGGYFPIKVLPKAFMLFSFILPLTYVYDSIRAVLIKQTPLFSLRIEFLLVIASMIVFFTMGVWIFNTVERKCRKLGILGTH